MFDLVCIGCGATYQSDAVIYTCKKCGHLLEVRYDLANINITRKDWQKRPISVWRYRELLPVSGEPVTLQEGGTPLYHLKRIGEELGIKELYAKHEGMNPSGSFKDRGMTVGVSMALQLGMKSVACASTGNTSASLAVYGAKAGIPVIVLLPSGKVALGKVAQALMHGAKVISSMVTLTGHWRWSATCVRQKVSTCSILSTPTGSKGRRPSDLKPSIVNGEVPDRMVLPVGNAGNISAVYKGLIELSELGFVDKMPMMTGIQAEGSQPVVRAIKENLPEVIPEGSPETVATAIRIGAPVNAEKVLHAIRMSKGTADFVTDEEILAMQRDLAQKEGIGVEPASAASVAGVKKLVEAGVIDRDERIVCVVTGHLLKDPETVIKQCAPPIECDATLESLLSALQL